MERSGDVKSRSDSSYWELGYVHVYTGNGKGKTTAALGLALRSAGAGMPVFFGQFIKGRYYSEIAALRRFEDLITVRQYGRGCFLPSIPSRDDVECAQSGLAEVRNVISQGQHKLVVLDEVSITVCFHLISEEELLGLVHDKPEHVELVITGRYAPASLLESADLVTEMQEVKHYFNQGVLARRGIEV